MSDERIYQLALTRVKGLGPIRQKKLIEHFTTASSVFQASVKELSELEGLGQIAARKIKKFSAFDAVEKDLVEIDKRGISTHFYTDKSYPNRLRFCDDSPVLLYSSGNIDFNREKFVAIVGTRRATNYGKRMLESILEGLSSAGITLVSGLAYGIDIHAHISALKYDIQNIAVLAHGLDKVYPDSHASALKKMAKKGGAVSEYTLGVKPDRENFPERNRIIAGLADATIVVESKRQGGAMITAEIADGYHRDVFAVPGKIEDPLSAGCNYLIKRNKAHLLESAEDLLRLMNWKEFEKRKKLGAQKKLFVQLSSRDEQILSFLKEKGTCHNEEIAGLLGVSPSQLALHMLELEMNGLVRSHPGGLYSIC